MISILEAAKRQTNRLVSGRKACQIRASMDCELSQKISCNACYGSSVVFEAEGEPESPLIRKGRAVCLDCSQTMSIVESILEGLPKSDPQLDFWETHYSNEDQSVIIAALEKGFQNRRLLYAHYPIIRMIRKLTVPLESSIELGCGSGAFSLVLKKTGTVDKVTLLDYSRASLEAARSLFSHFGESCNLVHADIESAPFRRKTFDLSLSGGVIEHFRTEEERLDCLNAHLDIANRAFLQAPVSSPCYWLSRSLFSAYNRGWPFGFEKPVTFRELCKLAKRAGAEILDHDHQYFLSFPLFTRLHKLPKPGWYTWPFLNEIAIIASK